MSEKQTIFAGVIDGFLRSNMAVLLIIVSLCAGFMALSVTPREEEPQIVVPLADIMVFYPGGSAEEVERMVSSRLERLLYQIDGVEYVYSISRPGMSIVTVRYYVGEDREESLIKLYNKMQQNMDKVTPGITGWIVKPIEIDDVPIVNVALYSDFYDSHSLYRVAEELADKLQRIDNSARITITGGEKRVVYVHPDTERLTAYGLTVQELTGALGMSNAQMETGTFKKANQSYKIAAGEFLTTIDQVKNLLVGVHEDRPVYMRDVAEVTDGPAEKTSVTTFGLGPAGDPESISGGSFDIAVKHLEEGFNAADHPAVTLAVAKKKGSNAVIVAQDVERMFAEMDGVVIPDEVKYRITRNYGETANDKVNNLVESLIMAIIAVIGLIAFTMSWREGLVVATAVPITYSLSLLINYLLGYTINRVTLFALILALGLLVDDPIVGVDNISRHLVIKRKKSMDIVAGAMKEVIGPVIMSTLAIIASFIPMFFITGMMGPYMGPMALNVPLAVTMSTVVALAVTPWVSFKLLKAGKAAKDAPPDEETSMDFKKGFIYKFYNGIMRPVVTSTWKSLVLLFIVAALFVFSLSLAATGRVPLKMLPFDNKNEFQVLIDMPEGTPLESTKAVCDDVLRVIRAMPEVTDYTVTAGDASPIDFNGLVRHYYLRQGPNLADIRVNLVHRTHRDMSSHKIVLRIRDDIDAIEKRTGANIKLIEVPPGPPVLSTVVAEIYGDPGHTYDDLINAAQIVKKRMAQEPGIVDLDDTVESLQRQYFFNVDKEKSGLNGISTKDIVDTLNTVLEGRLAGTLHVPTEQNELPVIIRLKENERSGLDQLKSIILKGRAGNRVQLGELGDFEERIYDKTIYHKNQRPVVYVTAETAGIGPAYAVIPLKMYFADNPLPGGIEVYWEGEGEWKITIDVFRDLGIAFSIALLAIFALLVYESGSYLLPVIIMLAIPLTMIGIMPGFWLLNAVIDTPVGGYATPVFFTATAMIGMIALGGIVIRNSIILIDFINSNMAAGSTLIEAIIDSGAVRFRPIFLTTLTTMLGAWPITLDPIFSGLAWSLIFGLFVSSAFTLFVIPTVFYLVYAKKGDNKQTTTS